MNSQLSSSNQKLSEQEAVPSVSVTGIMSFLESPQHYHCFHVRKERQPTQAMEDGKMLHMLVLERDRFYDTYCTTADFPEGTRLLKTVDDLKAFINSFGAKATGKSKVDFIAAAQHLIDTKQVKDVIIEEVYNRLHSNGKQFVGREKWDAMHKMRAAVLGHKVAKRYMNIGKMEVKVEGQVHGVHVRGRLDWIADDESLPYIVILDLKKTRSMKFNKFRYEIWDRNYYVQAFLYTKLVEMQYNRPVLYMWVGVEGALPYICETYSADEATLEAGEKAFKWAVVKLRECIVNDNWPGYTDGMVHNINLPSYGFDRVAEMERDMDTEEQEYESI